MRVRAIVSLCVRPFQNVNGNVLKGQTLNGIFMIMLIAIKDNYMHMHVQYLVSIKECKPLVSITLIMIMYGNRIFT